MVWPIGHAYPGENGHGKRVFQKPSPVLRTPFCTRVDG